MQIYRIDQDVCGGCGSCAAQCAAGAIKEGASGEWQGKYRVCFTDCLECGSCLEACPLDAIVYVEKEAQDDADEAAFAKCI